MSTPPDYQITYYSTTTLSRKEIANRLRQTHAIQVSDTVVKQLLAKHNFSRRKAQKK